MKQSGLASFGAKFAGAAAKFGNNKYIVAIVEGMMATMPLTIGASLFLILAAFPIDAWQDFVANIGMMSIFFNIAGATINVMGLFTAMLVAYSFTKNEGQDGKTGAIFAVATMLFLVPFVSIEEYGTLIPRDFLDAQGLLIGMIVGILIAKLYVTLIEIDKLTIKMPESVPPAVANSLRPTFVAMIIFGIVVFVERLAAFTNSGGLFMLINDFIAQPFLDAGLTWGFFLVIVGISCILFFFGVHPNVVRGPYMAVMTVLGNTALAGFILFQESQYSGATLDFINAHIYDVIGVQNGMLFSFLFAIHQIGGTGATIGLAISMWFSKSARYKVLGKIAFWPSLFNINEPLIFGVPIMLNPILFLPMLLAPAAGMTIVAIAYAAGVYNYWIVASLPWTLPFPIGQLMLGGLWPFVISLLVISSFVAIWFPFFIIADRQVLKQEKEEEARLAAESSTPVPAIA